MSPSELLRHPRAACVLLLLTTLAAGGCAVNPATGQRQLALYGEQDEVGMGREGAKEVDASLGLYPDAEVASYVSQLGKRLAATSERPDLPWTFQVIDDPVVNAFALPGGFIYVTRGILAHLDSEAELASVVGHEIGHVTARHSVTQLSKQSLLGLGLGLGMAVSPSLARFGDLAQTGLGLLFLKYSRDDERQADDLGLRYMIRGGYDPHQMSEVFHTLDRVGQSAGGDRIPAWMSTHPDPGERARRIGAVVTQMGQVSGRVERDSYIRRLDGMTFGEDPRQGFFKGATFIHPELAFRLTFPGGWKTANQRRQVLAVSPEQDAAFVLTLDKAASPEAGLDAFLAQEGVQEGRRWRKRVHSLSAIWASFEVPRDTDPLAGRVVFVAHGSSVYRMLAFSPKPTWIKYEGAVDRSLESFDKLTDPALLAVQPAKIEIVTLTEALGLEQLQERYPSTAPLKQIALINHLEPGAQLPAGALFKRVVGGPGADAAGDTAK